MPRGGKGVSWTGTMVTDRGHRQECSLIKLHRLFLLAIRAHCQRLSVFVANNDPGHVMQTSGGHVMKSCDAVMECGHVMQSCDVDK